MYQRLASAQGLSWVFHLHFLIFHHWEARCPFCSSLTCGNWQTSWYLLTLISVHLQQALQQTRSIWRKHDLDDCHVLVLYTYGFACLFYHDLCSEAIRAHLLLPNTKYSLVSSDWQFLYCFCVALEFHCLLSSYWCCVNQSPVRDQSRQFQPVFSH